MPRPGVSVGSPIVRRARVSGWRGRGAGLRGATDAALVLAVLAAFASVAFVTGRPDPRTREDEDG